MKNYAVLIFLLTLVAISVLYGVAADSTNAALLLNGVMVNLLDPVIWLLALPLAATIRKDTLLLPLLFILACIVCAAKLYLQFSTGSQWITGSIIGNVIGFVTTGYLINAVVVFRRGCREAAAGKGA